MNVDFYKQVFQERKRIFILVALLLLVNIILYIYAALYQDPQLSKLHRQVAEKREAASGGVTQDAAQIYRQGKADLATWREKIAPKREFARLVGDLFQLAGSNSLKVSGVTYRPDPVKEENLLAYTIDFNVSGKYAAIKSFIADVARMKDILYINNISLKNTKPTEEAVNMKLQMTALFRMEGQ